MRARADACLPHRDTADPGGLPGHLVGRGQAAEAGLGALAELYLDGPDVRRGELLEEALHAEAPAVVAAAEVAGADLPDEFAAVAVVRGDPALAGVLHAARDLRAAVDGLH